MSHLRVMILLLLTEACIDLLLRKHMIRTEPICIKLSQADSPQRNKDISTFLLYDKNHMIPKLQAKKGALLLNLQKSIE